MEKTLFVGIPVHDGKIHISGVAGLMQTQTAFYNRCAFDVIVGSFLPRNRDILISRFVQSGATHMLCLDSDIGFGPSDVKELLDCDVDFVSGCYSRKNNERDVPARITGVFGNGMLEAEHVPAGFLMLSRQCVDRMIAAYSSLRYQLPETGGDCYALWSSTFEPGKEYTGEDVAFCKRWRDIGGSIYLKPSVVVRHYGDHCYLPKVDPHLKFTN